MHHINYIFFIFYLFTDEPKLNPGSWEDPLPIATSGPHIAFASPHTHRRCLQQQQQQKYNSTRIPTRSNNKTSSSHQQVNNLIVKQLHQSLTLGNNTRKRLEHTPSARTVSSEESWCSEGVASDRDLSSDDDDDAASDRSNSITSTVPRNSQLRLTFNKAKQHLSFDKWRNNNSQNNNNNQNQQLTNDNNNLPTILTPTGNGASNMPSAAIATQPTTNDSPSAEPFSRLSRWFSIRRGSGHQQQSYDVDKSARDSTRASSVEVEVVDAAVSTPAPSRITNTSARMPQLNENDEELAAFGLLGAKSNGTLRAVVRPLPPSLPPAPPGLNQQQLKRRHIVAAIVHSENSYVATLQRLVNVSVVEFISGHFYLLNFFFPFQDYKKPLEESNPPILSSTKIGTLFHRLPEIVSIKIQ